MWTSKYAGELVGMDSQFDAMSEWLAALERGDPACKPVMILAGPTGSGKTASAHKLLTQRGYRVIERHGADHRTKTAFENDILQTVRSSWNGMIRQGVLMEDIDSITVTTNNCGLDVLIRIASALTTADGVPREVTPVICTMDDVQSRGKLNDLVKKCHIVIFGKVCSEALQELGRRILQKEGAICSEDRLLDLATTASGDARWLVNALELEQGGSGQLQPRKVALAAAADRKQLEEKEAVRRMLYASKEPHEEGHLARLELLCSGQEPFTITSLVQENYVIACGEDTDAAARLADMSSHVDLVDSYIHRTQDWSFMETLPHMGVLPMAVSLATATPPPPSQSPAQRQVTSKKRGPERAAPAGKEGTAQMMRRKRCKRGVSRSEDEGSINLCSAWSKFSYTSAKLKKLADLRASIRRSSPITSGFDLEWLLSFSAIIRGALAQETSDKGKMGVLAAIARGYGMDARLLDDCLKLSGGAGLTRSVLSRLGEALSCDIGKSPGHEWTS